MNLGQAVAVCLYELVRDAKGPGAEKKLRASAGEAERITAVLLEALHASGYVNPGAAGASEEKVRRLVRRLQPRRGRCGGGAGNVAANRVEAAAVKPTPEAKETQSASDAFAGS